MRSGARTFIGGLTCVVSPSAIDAKLTLALLSENGIAARAFDNLRDLAINLDSTIGCVVVVEDALIAGDIPELREALNALPAWSDLPLIVVAYDVGQLGAVLADAFPDSGNVTLLERPLNLYTLLSAVRVGLRATFRQRQVGELIAARDEAVKLRDEFLAMLAHELRNPLAPMLNAVHLMRMTDIDDARVKKSTDVLERQINHVTRMVDDLMDVARLERSKLVLQKKRVNLNHVVAAAVESALSSAQAHGHTIDVHFDSDELPVDIDAVRIEQVVCNLINNAVKFTPAPSEIRVETFVEANYAAIAVEDRGIGFAPDTAENLFAPFSQANPTLARSAGGLGIGLTIVRRLAELHGGSAQAISAGIDRGARFIVRIPLATTAPAVVETRVERPVDIGCRRVVIIEDNADIRETLQVLISLWGHTVSMAADGVAGLELVLRERPDVALIDVGLPLMNGYEVAKAIKAVIPAGTKLVAVTGYGQPGDKAAAAEAGFDMHLLKPIEPQALQKLLATNFENINSFE
jgi:two-component system, sensor histidine kinase